MVQTRKTGFAEVLGGRLFWRYDGPIASSVYGKGSTKPLPKDDEPKAKPRPILLFIHAAITDHTLWDTQIDHFNNRGWGCLRYDLFGFGQSTPSEQYLKANPRPAVNHHDHARDVTRSFHREVEDYFGPVWHQSYVVIGCSHGAEAALDFALADAVYDIKSTVVGMVLCAGGIGGYEGENTEKESQMFELLNDFMAQGDIENAVKMNVRIWGDGLQSNNDNRLSSMLRAKLTGWSKDILQRQHDGIGGSAFPSGCYSRPGVDPANPFLAAHLLHTITWPTLIATGKYDETATTESMMKIATALPKTATHKEFKAAHLINLECPKEFNDWVDGFLQQFIPPL